MAFGLIMHAERTERVVMDSPDENAPGCRAICLTFLLFALFLQAFDARLRRFWTTLRHACIQTIKCTTMVMLDALYLRIVTMSFLRLLDFPVFYYLPLVWQSIGATPPSIML